VYSIDSEADTSADAAAGCIGELITSGGVQLCSCRFLVPHFSAFAVVDTSPSNSAPSSSRVSSSTSKIVLSVAACAAAAVMVL
jgi:hypothetical protein